MRVGIIAVFTDYHRRGAHHRGGLQPQIGPLIAALLPDWCEVEIINDTWEDPDWSKSYDLVFRSCVHADFDRARFGAFFHGSFTEAAQQFDLFAGVGLRGDQIE